MNDTDESEWCGECGEFTAHSIDDGECRECWIAHKSEPLVLCDWCKEEGFDLAGLEEHKAGCSQMKGWVARAERLQRDYWRT